MPNVIIVRNDYPDAKSLYRVINYVLKNENLAGGYGVPPNLEAAYLQMQFVKRAFYQTDALQLKHFFITLSHTEAAYIDDDELLEVTPKSLRIRKKILDKTLRLRSKVNK